VTKFEGTRGRGYSMPFVHQRHLKNELNSFVISTGSYVSAPEAVSALGGCDRFLNFNFI